MHGLEIGQLGLVAGLDEGLEGRLDHGRDAAAQECLLSEEVGLGLLGEGRLEDAGAGAAEATCIGHGPGATGTGWILLHREQGRHTTTTDIGGTMRPNRMLKPWANINSWPARRLGAISLS